MAKKKKQNGLYYKISRRIYGIALIILSVAVLATMCFYSEADSSFNLATDKVNNPLGQPGSDLASIIITFTGISLPLFLIVVMLWGYKLCRLEAVSYPWLRLLTAFIGVHIAAMGFDALVPALKLGGELGNLENGKFLELIPNFCYLY